MREIAGWIAEVLADPDSEAVQQGVRSRVEQLCRRFPIYEKRLVRSRAQMS
jgi:glycine/serine hydroxymethyltransferase